MNDMRKGIKKVIESAAAGDGSTQKSHWAASVKREAAEAAQTAMDETIAWQTALDEFDKLKNSQQASSKLGELIKRRNIKVGREAAARARA